MSLALANYQYSIIIMYSYLQYIRRISLFACLSVYVNICSDIC